MASEALAKLQATTNRYASKAGFSPLTIDGGMGPKTETAVKKALMDVSVPLGFGEDIAVKLRAVAAGVPAQTVIMQNVQDLNTILDASANALKLPPAATVALVKPVTGTPVPDKAGFNVMAPPGAGMIDKMRLWFRQLPTWQQIGVGVGGAVVVLGGISAIRGKKAAGVSGYRRR